MSGDKTERPTAKRLRDLRRKGQVPLSREVVASALLVSFFALLYATMGDFIARCRTMIVLPARFYDEDISDSADQLMANYLLDFVYVVAPFLVVVVIVTFAATVFQVGLLLTGETVKPSLQKLNPASNIKKVFSVQNLVDFFKNILKVGIMALLVFMTLKGAANTIRLSPLDGFDALLPLFGRLLTQMAVWSAAALIVVAGADYGYQRFHFYRKNRMSKDEVKREYKESEGDPRIKGMRRQLHQQMLAEGKVDRARKATVLITNPTHVAVALFYEKEETPLPVVTAIGTDREAQRMMEAAEEAGVPIMRNVPLARALLETGAVDQYIPSDLIELVAEVLRALQKMKQETP